MKKKIEGCGCGIIPASEAFQRFPLFVFAVLVFVFSFRCIYAQSDNERGHLLIRNYHQKEYKAPAQNFAIVQDKRGVMYFANNGGVLEYDGTNWRLINVANNSPVRSLAIDSSGTIFVGAQNELGYLESDSSGKLRFHSLIEHIKEHHRNFDDILCTHSSNEGIYFQSTNKIFLWDGKKMNIVSSQTPYGMSFYKNNRFYAQQVGAGLVKIQNDFTVQHFRSSDKMLKANIRAILEFDSTSLLIVSKQHGLFKLHLDAQGNELDIVPFPTNIDSLLGYVYNCIQVSPNEFSLGVWGIGILLMDRQGRLLQVINKETGLNDDATQTQYIDMDGNLWLALESGISKVQINYPISFFDSKAGVNGTIESVTRYKENLYIATNTGISYLEKAQLALSPKLSKEKIDFTTLTASFKQLKSVNMECFSLLTFRYGKEEILLVAPNDGIYQINDDQSVTLVAKGFPWFMHQSSFDSARVYIGLDPGLMSIYRKNGKWLNEGPFPEVDVPVRKIAEDRDGNLWLSKDNQEKLIKMSFQPSSVIDKRSNYQLTHYDSSNGVPFGFSYAMVKDDNSVLLATAIGLYKYSKNNNIFERDDSFHETDVGIHRIKLGYRNNIWMVRYHKSEFDIGFLTAEGHWYNTPFKQISKGIIHAIYNDADGATWLGGLDGLFRYNPINEKDYSRDYRTLIRKVTLGENNVIFWGTNFNEKMLPGFYQPDLLKHNMPYSKTSITFEFSALSYENETASRYSYYLEGFDENWTDWKEETKSVYTNLHEGTYRFHAKSKNIFGKESLESVYEFTVLPPWYRTIWAYIGYVLLFIGVVYGAVLFSTAQLRVIIRERTAEVVKQKDEIEKKSKNLEVAYHEITHQKELIEEKNRDILDSIRYAKRIQDAILPPDYYIKQYLKESFILFKPRDIVSGDFFFFAPVADKTQCVIAAVDCTGHGVPGAFVSIVGNNGLSRAINEYKIIQPAAILDKLNELVEQTFKQQDGTSVKDGMDIALCHFDLKTGHVEYSGANNPIYVVRNTATDGEPAAYEIKEIKANKQPIGAFEDRTNFSNHNFSLRKNDKVYIFTDGYCDQFGGPKEKKFMYKPFKELLFKIHEKSMQEQKAILDVTIDEWKKNTEQTDDITVIGVKIC